MLGSFGVRLGFDGAGDGRHENWIGGSRTDVNNATRRQGAKLRERSRDLARNDAVASTALAKLAVATYGIDPRPDTGDQELDAQIAGLWAEWSRSASSDTYLGMRGLQHSAIAAMHRDGGVLVRARTRRESDGLPVPMQLELIPIDRLITEADTQLDNGGRIVQGVEFDALGRIAAYHVWTESPSSQFFRAEKTRIPESVCCHLYHQAEIGQVRGVPHTSTVMPALRDLQTLGDSVLARAITETSLVGFVVSPEADEALTVDGQDSANRDDDGRVVEEINPGTISYLKHGQDVKFNSPSGTSFDEARKIATRQVAAALGVTYEQISGDLTGTNWTSYKAGHIDHRAFVRWVQNELVIPLLMRRVWVWFLDAGIAAGVVPARARARRATIAGGGSYEVSYPCKWTLPNFAEVDREAEYRATAFGLRNGLLDPAREVAAQGHVMADLIKSLASFRDALAANGLVLDSVPAQTTTSGQVQQPTEPAAPRRSDRP